MNRTGKWQREKPAEIVVPAIKDSTWVANDIAKKAIHDAKGNLHPLLQGTEIYELRQRSEFVNAFKLALERRVAQRLAVWHPGIQAVYKFDKSWMEARRRWDGSIHLLVKVPHLSDSLKTFGDKLDQSLTERLKQLGWPRFLKHSSLLEVQQITIDELRHGIGYGAMFYAVYSVPVKVWPTKS